MWTDPFMVSIKRRSLLIVYILAFVGCTLLYYNNSVHKQSQPIDPYLEPDQLMNAIGGLATPWSPETPGELSGRQWLQYVQVARRLQKTDPIIISQTFRSNVRPQQRPTFELSVMILLRVAFVCPKGMFPSGAGGWVLGEGENEGKPFEVDNSMNAPVAYSWGHFRLTHRIVGYTGRKYDPDEEFRWRLDHCKWREF
jgi:hypothetical protein